jgi:hypothetical protein
LAICPARHSTRSPALPATLPHRPSHEPPRTNP